MAVAAVFALPELHEAILWQTDMVTLLVSAQRVSKAWRDLITASPTLQQKLFFQPVPGDAHPSTAMPLIDRQGADDLVDSATEDLGKLTEGTSVAHTKPAARQKAYFRAANSFMALPWTPNPREEKLDGNGFMRSIPVDSPEDTHVQPFRERFFRRGASWRRMLVTQPTIRQLGYLWSQEKLNGRYLNGNYAVVVKGAVVAMQSSSPTSGALRMGPLCDLVQERCCRHELHNLWFRVHWEVIQGPAYYEYSADLGSRLMVHSRMVVEILEQQYPRINPQKLKSPKVFDDVFRCGEHERLEIMFGENDPSKTIAVMRSGVRGLLSKFNAVHDGKDLVFREE
ncbi:F-box domain-containing protein [Akanthomyces lecanii RCEF 1005]|uniref:F-box domain-containing protein n=1 Tax=Akanthomyces lecanii RCEF 1005 TaxID=1081108 RepID=A0A168GB38_CORDF|nr:F-box domain-containing protein [Akanthomyces lecanii RCEF 1005]